MMTIARSVEILVARLKCYRLKYIIFTFSVATALQEGFLPYCEPVFKRCVSLVEQECTTLIKKITWNMDNDKPDL